MSRAHLTPEEILESSRRRYLDGLAGQGGLRVIKVNFYLDEFVRLRSVTFIAPGLKVLLKMGGAALVFHVVSDISYPIVSYTLFTDRLSNENARD